MDFLRFVIKRFLQSILVLVGLSILIFIITRTLPGDPARMTLGPHAPSEQVQKLRMQMGLNKPLPIQYWDYLGGLIHGDFGRSFITRRNVRIDILHYLPATLELVFMGLIWMIVLGLPLGILAGRYKDTWIDNFGRVVAFIGVAVPPFVVGLILQLVFGYLINILPTTGRLAAGVNPPHHITGFYLFDSLVTGNFGTFFDSFRHILLPSFATAMTGIGQIARITRSSVSDVKDKEYIEASRSFGIPERYISFKYLLRPSFIPPLTILGLTVAAQLSNAFLVEVVFGWPGMAKFGIRAILRKDFNAIIGVVLVIGVAFAIANTLVDVIAGYVDPRIRIKGEEQ